MTIYDIAREAGVAASTVSRVMNNKPGIREETRQRILALLKKYNYTPDAAAQSLSNQATRMIGIVIADIRVIHHTNSAFLIERELKQRGYCTMIMGAGQTDEERTESLRIMGQRRVEGVILMGSTFQSEVIRKAIARFLPKVPVVMVNGYLELPNVSGVIVDEDRGIAECTRLLLKKGKRDLVFVLNDASPATLKKAEGFRRGMQEAGIPEKQIRTVSLPEDTLEQGYEITKRILTETPGTDGIIYSVDLIAVGGLRAARELGRRVPEDLAIIGVDNSVYGLVCSPRLTTLDNRMEELSLSAAEMLRDCLEGGLSSRKLMMGARIIERETT